MINAREEKMATHHLLLVCLIAAYLSAGDVEQPRVSQQSAQPSSWYTYWTQQVQQKAAPYVTNFQNFWQNSAQPQLKQWSELAINNLTGPGSKINLVEAIRQDDPQLILAMHKLCKGPQLFYFWLYSPPALVTTWLLRKAYLKGSQILADLSKPIEDPIALPIKDRIELLAKKREKINDQIMDITNQMNEYKRIHSLQEDDLFTYNIKRIADILEKTKLAEVNAQIDDLERLEALTEQAPLDDELPSAQSWLNRARGYLSDHWPKWLQR